MHRASVSLIAGVSLTAGVFLIAGAVAAEPPQNSRAPIVIDSALTTIDDTTNTADFTAISVTQGSTHITADRAHVADIESKHSRWTFTGRVVITSQQRGSLSADQAILEYRDGALDRILATGAPVRFEKRPPDSGQGDHGPADHGQADEITYQAASDTLRLRGHPHISAGSGLEMSAPMIVYHIRDGRLQAYSDNGTRAVHIVTQPVESVVP